MGRSRVTCRTQTEPQQADGPSSNHPAAAHGPGNKGLCLPLPGRGWSNIHPSVRAGRALRCWLVQEDFKPRGKGLTQGRGATQREDLGHPDPAELWDSVGTGVRKGRWEGVLGEIDVSGRVLDVLEGLCG